MYLSQTIQIFMQMPIFELKGITFRLLQNIRAINNADKKQSSLQFNIWKYCLEQRMLDETIFTFILTLVFYGFILQMQVRRNQFTSDI